jgi:hypothetical protein
MATIVAVFIALGTASRRLPRLTITSEDVKDGSLTGKDIKTRLSASGAIKKPAVAPDPRFQARAASAPLSGPASQGAQATGPARTGPTRC